MTHIRGCEEVLRLGSEIRNVTDSIIEALEYVNAVSMVCVPCATMPSIDAAMLDSATNTAKEIETIAMRASDIVSDVFSETGRVMHGGVLTPPTTLPAGVSEMSALVDRAGEDAVARADHGDSPGTRAGDVDAVDLRHG